MVTEYWVCPSMMTVAAKPTSVICWWRRVMVGMVTSGKIFSILAQKPCPVTHTLNHLPTYSSGGSSGGDAASASIRLAFDFFRSFHSRLISS